MQVKKAIEISDAKIQFVSLVDKAANLRQFLITKAEDGIVQFSTFGKILKTDAETHYLTGIVYEPFVEDAHGNFMTELEIQKAAYWFAKNGDQVDLQHSFEEVSGVSVVENYIAPCDMVVGDTPVVKGTWLITVEVCNSDIWSAVEKGQITGFSMGGLGKYSEEDIDLNDVNKTADPGQLAAGETTAVEKKSILKRFAEFLGLDVVEKGAMLEAYAKSEKYTSFWNAFHALEDMLYRYNWTADSYEFETDEAKIKEALEEFSSIIASILAEPNIAKGVLTHSPLLKSGKKMSSANQKKLDAAYQTLAELREALVDSDDDSAADSVEKKEEINMDENKIQEMVTAAVTKALEAQAAAEPTAPEPATPEATVSTEDIQKMIDESVAKAMAPILQARGLPSNLNDAAKPVEKANDLFAGVFI